LPYTAPTSFFSDYGAHVRIWEEVRVLQQRGHRLVMATYHNGDDMPGLEIHRSWDVPWVKRAMVGSSRHKLYLDVALSWRALRVALKVKPDLIHAHLHEGALIGAVLRRMLGVPLVFDYQGSLTAEMIDHGFLQAHGALHRPLRAFERTINEFADALITSTHNAATMLRRDFAFPEERLYTIIDCVNIERFRPFDGSPVWAQQRADLRKQLGIPAERRVVAYLGLLAPYQGTNVLLEAARLVLAQRPDVHFLVMGYPDVTSYQALAESLGIASHVTLPGRIYYRDAHAYLALGDVAVAPKMSATEGAGKISNYLAMGLPVVTFDTPVSREILGSIGVYARLGSAQELAAAIVRVLDDELLAQQLRVAGRQLAVEHHSWERAAHDIEAIYARVLEHRSTSGKTRGGRVQGEAVGQKARITPARKPPACAAYATPPPSVCAVLAISA
jgi:glycosyltransferase involved in cell wall biosynthesis